MRPSGGEFSCVGAEVRSEMSQNCLKPRSVERLGVIARAKTMPKLFKTLKTGNCR
jgi:hypothetical protein